MTINKRNLMPINLDNYKITGFYYTEGNYSFRKYLNIKKKDFKGSTPDLMAIMMNPGSSEPLNKENNGRVETEAKPDHTQHQIIRTMEKFNLSYARILNLSDLREPKCMEFYKKIDQMNNEGINHSIFDKKRDDELINLYVKGVPVIYAWGVNKKLVSLAKSALLFTRTENSIGWKKSNYDFAYYHPLPRSFMKQIEWYENIDQIMKKAK